MAKPKQSHWQALHKLVKDDDGLPTRKVRHWTYDKLWWWNQYIEITTKAMIHHWPQGLVYVDLFAGPGICENRTTNERIPGSPIIGATSPLPFRRLLLCEKNPQFANACETRLLQFVDRSRFRVFVGDCNVYVEKMVTEIPRGTLTLAFVDPTGLHVDFETLRLLTYRRKVDLLILLADKIDIIRNVKQYDQQASSNLDEMLGPDADWRSRWKQLPNHDSATVSRLFVQIYLDQLKKQLGYTHVDSLPVRFSGGRVLYQLIYASKHPRGLDFWQKSTKHFRTGKTLF